MSKRLKKAPWPVATAMWFSEHLWYGGICIAIASALFAETLPVLVILVRARDPEHHLLSEPVAPTIKTRLMSQLEPPIDCQETKLHCCTRMSQVQINQHSYL